MELDWSEQSSHIRTLYRAWQPGDGYEETMIRVAEERFGIHLPATLRSFYRAWGQRRDLTNMNESLLGPHELVVQADTVIFCVENQAIYYWAVPRECLEESNPPVVGADAVSESNVWDVQSKLTWEPCQARLSDFLDDLTYGHALCGGAVHGGSSKSFGHQTYQDAWLEQHWHRASVSPMYIGLRSEVTAYAPPLYVRDGQALAWLFSECAVAARDIEALDEIGEALQITWARRW